MENAKQIEEERIIRSCLYLGGDSAKCVSIIDELNCELYCLTQENLKLKEEIEKLKEQLKK